MTHRPHSFLAHRKLRTCALVLALAGCDFLNGKTTKVGEEKLGDFSFLASSTVDSCLSALYGASLSFNATLTRTKETLFFAGPGGTIQGTLAGKTFTVTSGGVEMVVTNCNVARSETMNATLDDAGTGISGTYVVRIIPQSGSNCIAAIASGTFAALPCEVRYSLLGTRTDSPDAGVDGGPPDGGALDGGAVDGGAPDGGVLDGGTPDAGR